jgi:hypothetical protein
MSSTTTFAGGLPERIFCAEQIKIPSELPSVLTDYSKAVIRFAATPAGEKIIACLPSTPFTLGAELVKFPDSAEAKAKLITFSADYFRNLANAGKNKGGF